MTTRFSTLATHSTVNRDVGITRNPLGKPTAYEQPMHTRNMINVLNNHFTSTPISINFKNTTASSGCERTGMFAATYPLPCLPMSPNSSMSLSPTNDWLDESSPVVAPSFAPNKPVWMSHTLDADLQFLNTTPNMTDLGDINMPLGTTTNQLFTPNMLMDTGMSLPDMTLYNKNHANRSYSMPTRKQDLGVHTAPPMFPSTIGFNLQGISGSRTLGEQQQSTTGLSLSHVQLPNLPGLFPAPLVPDPALTHTMENSQLGRLKLNISPENIGPTTPDNRSESTDTVMSENFVKRKAYLAAEKRRRRNLGQAFKELREIVPACRIATNSKNSKEAMVVKAIDYIHYLNTQHTDMAEEIKLLRATLEEHGVEPPTEIKYTRKPTYTPDTVLADNCDSGLDQTVLDTQYEDGQFPDDTKTLILLNLLNSFFDEYVTQVDTSNIQRFCSSLVEFFIQNMTTDKFIKTLCNSIHDLTQNFNPQTDGANLRIRKWTDALNQCNAALYPEASATQIRQIMEQVAIALETINICGDI